MCVLGYTSNTDWCEGGIRVMERSRGKGSIANPLMTSELWKFNRYQIFKKIYCFL